MGPSASPVLADSALFVSEGAFMGTLKTHQKRKFSLVWRYLDYLLACNLDNFPPPGIHPEDLVIEKTNKDSLNCSFLDLVIWIANLVVHDL